MSYALARINMVNNQIAPNLVHDKKILQAIKKVPKHFFVPTKMESVAYIEAPIRLSEDRTIFRPDVFGRILQYFSLKHSSKVLDIGFGSGYSSAVLCQLVHHVTCLESIERHTLEALDLLIKTGVSNFTIAHNELTAGVQENAPYHAILINGAIKNIPHILHRQLIPGGKLAAVQNHNGMNKCMIYEYYHSQLSLLDSFDCHEMPVLF